MLGECERLVATKALAERPNMQKKGTKSKKWENRGKIDVATCDMGVSFDVVKGIELILNAAENIRDDTRSIGDE